MLELEVLIRELVAVDCISSPVSHDSLTAIVTVHPENRCKLTGLSTGAIALGEIAALDHEVLDNAVEGRALVAKALLAGGQSTEVLGCLGYGLAVKTHYDATNLLVAMLNVEVNLVGDLGALRGLGGLHKAEQEAYDEGGEHRNAAKIEHFGSFEVGLGERTGALVGKLEEWRSKDQKLRSLLCTYHRIYMFGREKNRWRESKLPIRTP